MSPWSRHLDAWSPVGAAVWGDIGGVALLEEVYLWNQALRDRYLPQFTFCFLLVVPNVTLGFCSSHHLCHLPLPLHHHGLLALWNPKPKQTFPAVSCLDHRVLSQQQESNR